MWEQPRFLIRSNKGDNKEITPLKCLNTLKQKKKTLSTKILISKKKKKARSKGQITISDEEKLKQLFSTGSAL